MRTVPARTAVPLLLLALATAGCTTEGEPDAVQPPSGPCAAQRVAPPEDSSEQRLQGDLDSDGRTDEVVAWDAEGGTVVQAWLADGRNADPEPLEGDLLAVADLDGDGGAEVLVGGPSEGEQVVVGLRGSVLALDDCRLVPVATPTGPLEFTYGSGADRVSAAATVRCVDGGLEQVVSGEAPEPGVRLVETTRWTIEDGAASAPASTSSRVSDAQDPALAADGTVDCG